MIIELSVLEQLASELLVPVYMEIPPDPPDSFVFIEKTGSGRENRINRATIAVQSYAKTAYKAALLNEEVKQVMDALPERNDIAASRLNADYNFTDTGSKRYRYQAVYDLVF